jgi:hypothetical protein
MKALNRRLPGGMLCHALLQKLPIQLKPCSTPLNILQIPKLI